MYGKAAAAGLWRRHALSVPVDLRRLIAQLDLEVVAFRFEGRVKEVIVGKTLGVQAGLPRAWFRWYVAHAIGHYVMHVGPDLGFDPWQWVNRAKAERQAEEFAARLTGGPDGWQRSGPELGVPVEKLALVRSVTGLRPP